MCEISIAYTLPSIGQTDCGSAETKNVASDKNNLGGAGMQLILIG
jgi:hypothetical protein